MYKKATSYLIANFVIAISALATLASPAGAVQVLKCNGPGGRSEVCKAKGDNIFGAGGIWSNIINMVLFLAGTAAVIMIIIGGIKYITSNGDQSQIQSAKNTILYSVVGLILAVSAGAIVNFVLNRL